MSIIIEDEKDFEAGTTITSKLYLTDRQGDITRADTVNGEDQVFLEVVDSDTEEVIRQEEIMPDFLDDNGDPYYLDTWSTSEDLGSGQYDLIHRAQVGDEPYKMTRKVDVSRYGGDC